MTKKKRTKKPSRQPGRSGVEDAKAQPSDRSGTSGPMAWGRRVESWLGFDWGPRAGVYARWLEILALVLVMILGAGIRLADLNAWRSAPQRAFYRAQPLMITYDAYHYLSLARDLVEETYSPVDRKRAVPDFIARPSPPPLISVLAAAVARWTSMSLSWIGALLPVVLGPLLAIPIFLLARFYGGPLAAIMASLMAMIAPHYAYRSNVGWFDTDCMNVTWATAVLYCCLRFGTSSAPRRYYFGVGAVVLSALFLWWWDQAPLAVMGMIMLPLLVALIFFYRPSQREGMMFYGFLLLALAGWWIQGGPELWHGIVGELGTKFELLTKQAGGAFPNAGSSINELFRPSFKELAIKTTGYGLAFIPAVVGIVWMFRRRFKESLFMVVPLLMGILSFVYARRLILYSIPVFAVGAGFLVSEIWRLRLRFRPGIYMLPLLVVVLVAGAFLFNQRVVYWPKEPPALVAGMDYLRQKSPADAVVWAWWDHGYTLRYWSRRGTISDGDGRINNGERTVYAGIPYAAREPRLAANFIRFFVVRGVGGLQQFYRILGNDPARGLMLTRQILSAGPQQAVPLLAELPPVAELATTGVSDWQDFFFPSHSPPVFLFVDQLLAKTCYWWHWFGTWDVRQADGVHPKYMPFAGLSERDGRIHGRQNMVIDPQNGVMHMRTHSGGQSVRLKTLRIFDRDQVQVQQYDPQNKAVFEMYRPARLGALMDENVAESVFNRLYLRHRSENNYFRPVLMRAPYFQIWEVRADQPPGGG